MRFASLALLLLAGLTAMAGAAPTFALRDGDRVLLLGDSITAAGGYAQYTEAYVRTRFPERRIEILNLGLPSETVSGQSEPDHPYPRPNVHERLDRALAKVRPTVVVACYGMNDGIYYPFSRERLQAYQAGIHSLVEKCRAAGARVVLLTPSAFDPVPVAGVVKGEGQPKYSWVAPYREYDGVLARYSRWLLTQRSASLPVGDVHVAVGRHLAAMRRVDPAYFTAADGVHPNSGGQWLLTAVLLETLGAPAEADRVELDANSLKARRGNISNLSRDDGGLRFTWRSRVPMPYDPDWHPRLVETEGMTARFNRYTLTVKGLAAGGYRLMDGAREVGRTSAAELARGVDLLRYPTLATNRRAAEVLRLVKQRERLLAAAWLTHVGHQRPGTPVGLPLAEAQARAAPLEEALQREAAPVELQMRVTPAE